MADLKDLIEKLKNVRANMPKALLEIATSVSITAKALSERTIKDKGFGEVYSNHKAPAWFFDGKELNASGSAFIGKKKKAKEGTNWKEFRSAQGLQTSHVDLSYSNKMWAGMFPQDAYQNGDVFIAPLGHNNKEGQNEMNWNRDRYGDFIGKALTGDNYDTLVDVAVEETLRFIFKENNI